MNRSIRIASVLFSSEKTVFKSQSFERPVYLSIELEMCSKCRFHGSEEDPT
jgi:hypothetical protein